MFRLAIILIVLGGFLGYEGYKEYTVGQGAGSEPVVVDLAELEGGADPPSPYIRIEEHIACPWELVYEVSLASGQSAPTSSSKVTHCYYPIISLEHPSAQEILDFAAAGNFQLVPPSVSDYRVLVKTHRIETYGEIESGNITLPDAPEGLVVNKINSLSDEEQNLLRQSYPTLSLEDIIILEEGRTPASAGKWAGMLGGGALLALIGVLLIIKPLLANRTPSRAAAPAVDEA